MTSPSPVPVTITVSLSADTWQGSASYRLWVDAEPYPLGGFTSIEHAAGQTSPVTWVEQLAPGPHVLNVQFLNDAWGGTPQTDRNLYVDFVSINGVRLSGSAHALYENGIWTIAFTVADPAAASPPPIAPPAPVAPPAGAVVMPPVILQPAVAGDIVGFNVQNPTAAATAPEIVTMGMQLEPGLLLPSFGVAVRILAGSLLAQFDVKTSWPDGSAQTGVLTFLAPAIPAATTLACMLVKAPALVVPPVNFSCGPLTVTLTNGLSAVLDIQAALTGGQVSHWRNGPIASERRTILYLSGSSMRVVADAAVFSDGSETLSIGFCNDGAMTLAGGPVSYDATIVQAGTITKVAGLQHAQYQHCDAFLLRHPGVERCRRSHPRRRQHGDPRHGRQLPDPRYRRDPRHSPEQRRLHGSVRLHRQHSPNDTGCAALVSGIAGYPGLLALAQQAYA